MMTLVTGMIACTMALAACNRAQPPTVNAASLQPAASNSANGAQPANETAADGPKMPLGDVPWGVKAGMTYADARKELVEGWAFIPMPFKHTAQGLSAGTDPTLARVYPEVTSCAGTGRDPCRFIFQDHLSGAYLVVVTEGEVDKHPGTDIGVVGVYTTTTNYAAAADQTDPTDADLGSDNLLTPFTTWNQDKEANLDDLNQGPDMVTVADGQQDYTFDGAAYVKSLQQRGYSAQTFNRADNDDAYRVDFIGKTPGDTIRIYMDADGYTRATSITKIVAQSKTLTGDALRDYLGQQAGEPLALKPE